MFRVSRLGIDSENMYIFFGKSGGGFFLQESYGIVDHN